MKLPYETATSGERALAELQRTLAKFGCQSFGIMTDNEKGATIVQFKWNNRTISLEASWKGYANAMLKNRPWSHNMRSTKQEYMERCGEQAKVSVCSVLRDWIKGQITAIECGVMSFEEAFMPHMLLTDGRRVIDKVRTDNLLPAPKDNVVEIGK
jgi:hypothetical protein